MGQVTALLTSIGWTLPVLPELDDLTVGEDSHGVRIRVEAPWPPFPPVQESPLFHPSQKFPPVPEAPRLTFNF